MTGEELIQLANDVTEEDIPQNIAINALNVLKNRRENLRPWQFLKKLNSANNVTPATRFDTVFTLPDDFRRDYKMLVGVSTEYHPLPFEQWIAMKNASQRYVIDIGANAFYLTGQTGRSATIYFFYLKSTPNFTTENLDKEILVWPTEFQALLSFDLAAYFQGGVDYDDTAARMSPFNRQMAKDIDESMIRWNTDMALRSMNDSFAGNGEAGMDLGNM